jgi:hypothetical protein|tara:strand:- start:274 stop:975 length:702 start_codon:yes stop_codon:yes gene_type:complete
MMSKSADERIAELEAKLNSASQENQKLQNYYSQAYKAMEDAKQNEAYYKGQYESSANQASQAQESAYDYSEPETANVNSLIEKLVAERLEPRLQMVERYATDALQQTAGREVDRALKSFKEHHPESAKIMDFERLIMLDAADEVKRRQAVNQPVGDVKEIALKIAEDRVSKYNKMESKIAEENRTRREKAERKAMVPDMFASAGFEELPKAPENAKEAGDLLEDLLRRQKGAN